MTLWRTTPPDDPADPGTPRCRRRSTRPTCRGNDNRLRSLEAIVTGPRRPSPRGRPTASHSLAGPPGTARPHHAGHSLAGPPGTARPHHAGHSLAGPPGTARPHRRPVGRPIRNGTRDLAGPTGAGALTGWSRWCWLSGDDECQPHDEGTCDARPRPGHPQRHGGRRLRRPRPPSGTADLAIDGERITAVGQVDGTGRREIDAEGKVVTPGFVDIHTHYDGQATWDPDMTPVELARRHHRRDGQLRRRLRPGRPGQARVAHPAHGGRRGHPRHRAGRGHVVELGDLPRVPRRARPPGPGHGRQRARPPRRRARLRHGRPRRPERRGHPRRDRGHGQGRARGGRGGRRRLLDHPHDPAPGQGRRAGCGHHRQRRRADRHRHGARRGRLGRVRAGQRHDRPPSPSSPGWPPSPARPAGRSPSTACRTTCGPSTGAG